MNHTGLRSEIIQSSPVIVLALLCAALAGQAQGTPLSQGDAVSPMAPAAPVSPVTVDSSEEDEGPPGLDQSVIRDVVVSRMSAIKHCYNKELKKNAELAGKVIVHFVIGAKGDVTLAEVKETTLKNEDVEKCMLEEVKTWSFPEPRGGQVVEVNFPFKFNGA